MFADVVRDEVDEADDDDPPSGDGGEMGGVSKCE